MCAYPGATPDLDLRQAFPKEIWQYYIILIPQAAIQHVVHLAGGESIEVPPPEETRSWCLEVFGLTVRLPLGTIVHARSGDKGSDCNVGFWVRRADEYLWLQNLLSTDFVKDLLADEYHGGRIERFEFKGLRAVHFLLKNHLDRGVSCMTNVDFLGKNCVEFLRARVVGVPIRFVARGII
ncbi:hypothetical protein NX059_005995 [Plenodomus lindquistii]|nr:hypothetical protein NX059_005995 [Plenodomus lindquistii]